MSGNTSLHPLSADEERSLRLFRKRVQDLRECGVVTHGAVTLKVDFQFGGPLDGDSIPFKGFDRDHFRSALSTLRQFLLNDDAVQFFKICKTIRRRCGRSELVAWSEYSRSFWKRTLESAPMNFRVGSKLYTVKDAIDLVLYGFVAHTKAGSADEWDSISSGGKATIYFIVQRSLFDLFYCLNLNHRPRF
ncbi:hypothetical protein [Planctellipticum variicoloris]|uniref:hypothetical protein n=1 Tax=Planctellipticum variicoloris TaxID=3064265 RepID=UPI00301362FA|nr:hypothetical protein SH412_002029 [Planctomycetaceae bacterium SH412]